MIRMGRSSKSILRSCGTENIGYGFSLFYPANIDMGFDIELPFTSGTQSRVAVLIVNLGTPDEPTPGAVRRYLAQFLSDRRVVEVPFLFWQVILRFFILPLRGRASAKKYASIWTPEGSPLRANTERQVNALRHSLRLRGHQTIVDYAMRYGTPAIPDVITRLKLEGVERVMLMPLYPQYSSSTTATAVDEVMVALRRMRNQPALRTVRDFCDHPDYIAALAAQVREYWRSHGQPDFAAGDRLVLSFHGVPQRVVDQGDPYHTQCLLTANLLKDALNLSSAECQTTFQSRFGPAQWLQPYTAATLKELAESGVRRADVFCPGFVADCLETVEEIGVEVRDEFLKAGGQEFHHIPCLNDSPWWISALSAIVTDNLRGWPTRFVAQSIGNAHCS